MQLTPYHRLKNTSFVLPDGKVLAQFKKGWLNPEKTAFGRDKGTNNYCDLWNKKDVYNQ